MKLSTWMLTFALVLPGCPDEEPRSPADPSEEAPVQTTEPRFFEGTLSIENEEDAELGEPGGSCEGTFALDGPWDGPWCGTGVATCVEGLSGRIGAEAPFEVCFVPYEQGSVSETLSLDFVEAPSCSALITTDITCAYDWEVSVTPERMYSEIVGSGFCGLGLAHVEVLAERVTREE